MQTASESGSRLVVGAVLVDRRNLPPVVLGARRRTEQLWEFPGGKVEPGEDPKAALRRELTEELHIDAVVGSQLGGDLVISDALSLRLHLATTSDEPVVGVDHDGVRWFSADQLASVEWLDADARALGDVRAVLEQS